MSDVLTMFVIYKHPKDYPDKWIVRRWTVDSNGSQPDLMHAEADSLELARTFIPGGMVRLSRNRDDDEAFYESWV